MRKKIIPAVLDLIFVFLATLAASFALLRFYLKSLFWATALSVAFATLTALLFRSISKRKDVTYSLKKEDAQKMEDVLNTLCLMTDSELTQFFSKLFLKMEIPFKTEENALFLTETGAEVRFCFTFSKVHEGMITDLYKRADKGRKLIVLGRVFSEEVLQLTPRFAGRIRLVDGANLYLTLKRFELFPEQKEQVEEKKHRLNLPKAMFNRKRARQYFLYGLALEFFSLFVFYPVYYICFGAALIVFSVVCFFFGIRDEPEMLNPFKD